MATEILKLTSAIVVRGRIIPAGLLIEVSASRGRNLRDRGKAEFATEDEITHGEIVARDFDDTVVPLTETEDVPTAEEDAADTSKRRRPRGG